ncbi:MAG: transcriptional repressor [Alphaproteobacteria bacterium]|uniref:Ferric uptake regulation protein n=1 Tax=Candidatus Nitrobium versatile TaxID=2884831 RepID=A0A953SH68_9BACT|nr:transcriptional repressor [Candidatus Nitrobium versatile]
MEKQKFMDFLSLKGFKVTREREEIINEILTMKGHFDPDELYLRLKTKGLKVSRASVYRTIPLLVESGLIEQVERVDKHAHYEKVSENSHHDHLICIKCGKVIEFYSPTLEMLQDEVCAKEKFKKVRHNLEIFGYCENCSR